MQFSRRSKRKRKSVTLNNCHDPDSKFDESGGTNLKYPLGALTILSIGITDDEEYDDGLGVVLLPLKIVLSRSLDHV